MSEQKYLKSNVSFFHLDQNIIEEILDKVIHERTYAHGNAMEAMYRNSTMEMSFANTLAQEKSNSDYKYDFSMALKKYYESNCQAITGEISPESVNTAYLDHIMKAFENADKIENPHEPLEADELLAVRKTVKTIIDDRLKRATTMETPASDKELPKQTSL